MAELELRQTIREQPFQSNVPVVGPLISWFRAAWNSIATRWYVSSLLQQQNEFNMLLVSYLRGMEAAASARRDAVDGWISEVGGWMGEMSSRLNEINNRLYEMGETLNEVDARMIGTDRDQTQLTRNVAEMSYQLTRLIRLSDEMNAKLTQTENRGQTSAPGRSDEE
jgi:hypothetical protein